MPDWLVALSPTIIDALTRIGGAIFVFIIGRWLIRRAVAWTGQMLELRAFEPTLTRYVVSLTAIVFNILLILGILSIFGIETTSFAALLAAMGLAIGAAWSGMLGNFAAGVFLILFKPFKVGDFVCAGGVTGTVKEIGMFATTIAAPDNVLNVVCNGKISADNIQNFSTYEFRAIDLRAQIAHGVDPAKAIADLKAAVARIPNQAPGHPALVDILEFNDRGTLLVVRPFAHNDHYWQVFFDTNRAVAETLTGAGYPVPTTFQTDYQYDMGSG